MCPRMSLSLNNNHIAPRLFFRGRIRLMKNSFWMCYLWWNLLQPSPRICWESENVAGISEEGEQNVGGISKGAEQLRRIVVLTNEIPWASWERTRTVPIREGNYTTPSLYSRRNKETIHQMHNQFSTPKILNLGNNSVNSPILVPTPFDFNILIAIRKGVRSCTQQPILKIVSYCCFNYTCKALATNLSGVNIPKNILEALENPKWRDVLEGIRALGKNNTWAIVELRRDEKGIWMQVGVYS